MDRRVSSSLFCLLHSPKCFGKNGCCRVYPLELPKRRKPGGGSLRRMSSESNNLKITFRGRWSPAQSPWLWLYSAVTTFLTPSPFPRSLQSVAYTDYVHCCLCSFSRQPRVVTPSTKYCIRHHSTVMSSWTS